MAVGQIPRSTERISFFAWLSWKYAWFSSPPPGFSRMQAALIVNLNLSPLSPVPVRLHSQPLTFQAFPTCDTHVGCYCRCHCCNSLSALASLSVYLRVDCQVAANGSVVYTTFTCLYGHYLIWPASLPCTVFVFVVVSSNQIVRLYSRFTSLDKSSNGYLR